jgi:hypothetical protein
VLSPLPYRRFRRGPGCSLDSPISWTVCHGVTSLLIAKPNFPWPPVERLVEDVLQMVDSGLFRPDPAAEG